MSLLKALNLPPLPALAASGRSAASKSALPKNDKLALAAADWRQTHQQASERIAALKAAARAHYGKEHPAVVQEIDKGLAKLDDVMNSVDRRLADSLASAGDAKDDRARQAELKNAKAILTQYIGYVKSEPLVAHIDNNPFGVKADLRTLLAAGLTEAARAIG